MCPGFIENYLEFKLQQITRRDTVMPTDEYNIKISNVGVLDYENEKLATLL